MSKRKRERADEEARFNTIKKKARPGESFATLPGSFGVSTAPEARHEHDKHPIPTGLDSHKDAPSESTAALDALARGKAIVVGEANALNGAEAHGADPRASPSPLQWDISNAGGGYLLNLDPVFSIDEKTCIRVYARATSLLVRSLSLTKSSDAWSWITGFKILESHPDRLYISLGDGRIELWDWKEGSRLGKWRLGNHVVSLYTVMVSMGGGLTDVVFTIDSKDSSYRLTAHLLQLGDKAGTALHTLFRPSEPILGARILEGGQCLVVCMREKLVIGIRKGKNISSLKDLNYDWHHLLSPGEVSTFDARTYQVDQGVAQPFAVAATPFDVDVVVGCSNGPMYLYRGILQEIGLNQKKINKPQTARMTKLHWHRDRVATVKWSLDGNYLISGGSETVLVLWQLDTGRKDPLPHLGAAIEAVSVSANGASYAIRLADNSAMVISTQELQPTTHVPGISMSLQISVVDADGRDQMLGNPASMGPGYRRPAVTTSKRQPFSILLAVPAVINSLADPVPSSSQSYLQTFDPSSLTRTSRQALTWTNVTNRNVGPEGVAIDEPHVVFIETSHDGQWLASVEEWAPPVQDLERLMASKSTIEARRKRQMEIVLKYWSWQDTSLSWELVSKIDQPHEHAASDHEKSSYVMDLCSDPSKTRFLTIGNDAEVRIWQPKQRTRGAIVVRGEDAEPLLSWACHQSVTLPGYANYSYEPQRNSIRGAFSGDGSLVAVACHCEPSQADPVSLLHLIDTMQGVLVSTRSGLFSGPVADIGFLGSTLILLSGQLLVWDLVADAPRYTVDLRAGAHLRSLPHTFHLQLDRRHGTFAVAVPTAKGDATRRGAYLAVFDPRAPAPLVAAPLPRPVRALAAAEGAHAYFAIDAHAEIHRAQAPLAAALATAPTPADPLATRGLEQLYGSAPAIPSLEQRHGSAVAQTRAGGHPSASGAVRDTHPGDGSSGLAHVTQDQLRRLWGHYDPLRLPPMGRLFEEVVALVSGVPS